MKQFSFVFLLACLCACSNDLDLTSDWKDIPVVYGTLNGQDNVHYIRIEKVFIDPETNAFQLAQRSDSLYHQNISVELNRPKRNQVITLEAVDGNTIGLPRDTGIFAATPNILYTFELDDEDMFDNGEDIELVIRTGENKEPVTARTKIVGAFDVVDGSPGDLINWENDRSINFLWNPSEDAQIFDVRFFIHIEESIPGNPDEFLPKTLEWVIGQNLLRVSSTTDRRARERVRVEGVEFFSFIGDALEVDPTIIRKFKGMDFEVIAGGEDLMDYITVLQSNTGITSSQVVPTFSNVEGGLGLFTSVARTQVTDIAITSNAKDSLVGGVFTRDLNFRF